MNQADTYNFDRSRLALSYDVARLEEEARGAVRHVPDFLHYSVVPLTTPGARRPEITDFSDPDWTEWVDSPLLGQCPYIKEVLDSLECRRTNVRLLRLEPGGVLAEHCDPQLNLDFRNQVRLHVPIVTDEHVDFLLNGRAVPLRPGELWYLRLSDPHSVHNNGATERIQLSIDVVFNDWVERMIVDGETE